MRLVVESGTVAGQKFEFSKDVITIGRGSTNDFALNDIAASRRHCQIRRDVSGFVVEDLDSANGTIVNGEKIFGARLLHPGDRIQVGQTVLTVEDSQPIPTLPNPEPTLVRSIPNLVDSRDTKPFPFALIGGLVAVLMLAGLGLLVLVFVLPNTPWSPLLLPPVPAVATSPARGIASRLPIVPVNINRVGLIDPMAKSPSQSGVDMLASRTSKGPANQVAWSRDQRLLAVASAYGIELYNAQTRTPRENEHFLPQAGWVSSVAFSPDSTLLATGSDDSTLHIWRLVDSQPAQVLVTGTLKTPVHSVAFSPDGKFVAAGSDDSNNDHFTVSLWRASDGSLVWQKNQMASALSVSFSPDSQWLAAGFDDKNVRVWSVGDPTRPVQMLSGHTGPVTSIAFSPDGKLLASGSQDYTVRLWQLSDSSLLRQLKGHINWVLSVAFSPDGQWIASSSNDHTFRVWQVSDGKVIHESNPATEHTNWIWSVLFNTDGTQLATGSWDGTIRIWKTTDWSLIDPIIAGHTHDIASLAFSPSITDTALLASGSDDNFIRLWRVQDNGALNMAQEVKEHTSWVDSVAFSPDGNTLASGGRDSAVRLWQVTDEKISRLGDPMPQSNWVRSVTFDPVTNTNILLTGTFKGISLWRVGDGKLASGSGMPIQSPNWVRSIAFSLYSPESTPSPATPAVSNGACPIGNPGKGDLVAAASDDGTIQLWRGIPSDQAEAVCILKGHTAAVRSLAFSPDRNILASASEDGTIRLWRVNDGVSIQVLTGHKSWVNALAFSPDGSILASGSWDKTIRLWQMRDGLMIKELDGHTASVDSLAFNRDGTLLASGGYDGTIRIWGVVQAAPTPTP